MRSLLSRLAAIVSLRAGPQDLPASRQLLIALLALDLMVSVIALGSVVPVGQALLTAGAALGLGLGFAYLALVLRGKPNRFLQTATALVGIDLVISVLALPLTLALVSQAAPDGSVSPNPALGVALLAVLAWNVTVVANTFRHALDQRWPAGVIVALAYVFLTTGVAF
jgi:hypothetical protein